MSPAACGSVVLGISAAAITIGATVAGATTTSGGRPVVPAGAPTTKTLDLDYVCNMSAYGETHVSIDAVLSAPASATAGSSVPISISTRAISTRWSADTTMQEIAKVSLSASDSVNDAGTAETTTLTSTAPTVVTTAGDIPASSATGNVTLAKAGTAVVAAPATLQILPVDAQGTQLKPITCTAFWQQRSGISIAVTASPGSTPSPTASPSPSTTPKPTPSASASASATATAGTGGKPGTQGSATPAPTGTPVGAPNTGGGRPSGNLPLVAGGAALLAVGAGLAFAARRRRHAVS